MLTLLWETPQGAKEIYETPGASYQPALKPDVPDRAKYDCHGEEHIAFQSWTAVQDDETGFKLHRTVISVGNVYVMNAMGKTIATYRFRNPDEQPVKSNSLDERARIKDGTHGY